MMKKIFFIGMVLGLLGYLYDNGVAYEAARAFIEVHLWTFVTVLIGLLLAAALILLLIKGLQYAFDTVKQKERNTKAVVGALKEITDEFKKKEQARNSIGPYVDDEGAPYVFKDGVKIILRRDQGRKHYV